MREAGDEIIGRVVRVERCSAREHGDHDACVCKFIGENVLVGRKIESAFIGLPSYYIQGTSFRIRRNEVKLLKNQKTKTAFEQPRLGQKVYFSSIAHGKGARRDTIYALVNEADTGELTLSATLDDCLLRINERGWVIVDRPKSLS